MEASDELKLHEVFDYHLSGESTGTVDRSAINALDSMNRGRIWDKLERPDDEQITFEMFHDFFARKTSDDGLAAMRKYLDYMLKRAQKASGLGPAPGIETVTPPVSAPAPAPPPARVPIKITETSNASAPTLCVSSSEATAPRKKRNPPIKRPGAQKILILHGFGHNRDIATFQFDPLMAKLSSNKDQVYTFDVFQGAYQLSTEAGDWATLESEEANATALAAAGRASQMDLYGYWATVLSTTTEKAIRKGKAVPAIKDTADVKTAVDRVLKYITEQGGYDGICAFSQGGKVAEEVQ